VSEKSWHVDENAKKSREEDKKGKLSPSAIGQTNQRCCKDSGWVVFASS
jgi:hypothetical protein